MAVPSEGMGLALILFDRRYFLPSTTVLHPFVKWSKLSPFLKGRSSGSCI